MSSSSAPSGTLSRGLDALLHRAAFAPIPNLGWIRVTGSERVRWLNGMVTNNIAALKPGEGNYNYFLNAQGRIQGDATIFLDPQPADETTRESACFWIRVELQQRDKLLSMLDHFIIMDDVALTAVEGIQGVLIAGPKSESLMESHVIGSLELPKPGAIMMTRHCDMADDIMLIRNNNPLIPTFEFWGEPYDTDQLKSELLELNAPSLPATPEDLEALRILSGTPLYGTDIRDKDLPQETNQDKRALHFSKGCYLGQEIVERIRSRGAVHRTFTGFILSGEIPPAGTALTVEEKSVGELTSVARIGDRILALGYIRREVLDRGASIQYPGGTATPSALPFPIQP